MTGFKSFAEPQEISIEDGMTGIVGPNGCGKSNIVEAIRWLMGESSARTMRGNDLDDVIFGGTTTRPSRNLAEVTLTLDLAEPTATIPTIGEAQISRKIERGKGSTYRINGKIMRAKDVQLLFADMATGARANGIVSQGMVEALVNAKPKDRRSLLEEAASISGLHQRRHDAERRLAGTQTNLERLDDIILQLGEQKSSLAKQARIAARYRTLAERLRKAEAHLLLTRFTKATQALDTATKSLQKAEIAVADTTAIALQKQQAYDAAQSAMPALRQAEAEAMAQAQRLTLGLADLDREEHRCQTQAQDIRGRITQIEKDRDREKQLLDDAIGAIKTLSLEAESLAISNADDAPKSKRLAEAVKAARAEAETAEEALGTAIAQSRASAIEAQNARQNHNRLTGQKNALEDRLQSLDLPALEDAVVRAKQARIDTEAELTHAQNTRIEAEADLTQARASLDEHRAKQTASNDSLARIEAEAAALAALIKPPSEKAAEPISALIKIEAGFENALASILGDGLAAPITPKKNDAQKNNTGKNGYWSGVAISTPPHCPNGTEPLAKYITAPPALGVALKGVGVVASADEAASLQASLAAGQCLTTPQGGLWRWDGFVLPVGVETAASRRLYQEKRLHDLTEQIAPLATNAEEARAKTEQSADTVRAIESALDNHHSLEAQATQAFNTALLEEQRSGDALESSKHRYVEAQQNLTQVMEALMEAEGVLSTLTQGQDLADTIDALTRVAEGRRQNLANAMSDERSISQARTMRDNRLAEITRQQSQWQTRQQGAKSRLDELARRSATAAHEEATIKESPGRIKHQRIELSRTLETAEKTKMEASDALTQGENHLRACEAELRTAEVARNTAREDAIRHESGCNLAKQQQDDSIARIAERLGTGAENLFEVAGLNPDDILDTGGDAITALEIRYDRLIRERENLGAVNLRAEAEMEEMEARITTLQTQHRDLTDTIATLTHAIGQINSEGQRRLTDSFNETNRYFGALFTTVFDGGTAQLTLTNGNTDGDTNGNDPLDAGLEILASPPGKKLQSLSLLSGGEKALTALALIFAVFLTNPSPICILDEVDAALDDSNVARFCALLQHIAERTGTKFIIITHHRLTMAKMDRLYGITMEQKGVSRIVSVDLQQAEKYKKIA